MRVLIAGVLAGITLFFWGFLAHTALPLGEIGIRAPADEDVVLTALKAGLPEKGIYVLPYVEPQAMSDEARMSAWAQKSLASPYAYVVYDPKGEDGRDMGDNLGVQLATDTSLGLLVAWLLSLAPGGLGRRLSMGLGIGLIGWLAGPVPYWNWYRYPLDFTLAAGVEAMVGIVLAALVAGWWLGRKQA